MQHLAFRSCALIALSLVVSSTHPMARAQNAAASSASFEIHIDEVFNKRRGGEVETSVVFRDPLTRESSPSLNVREGERVTIKLFNRTQRPRAFAIMGVKGAATKPIAAGARASVEFTAPARGNYIYHDPGQAALSEPRSLFGDFIVAPKPLH